MALTGQPPVNERVVTFVASAPASSGFSAGPERGHDNPRP